jgi:hypothetical protein
MEDKKLMNTKEIMNNRAAKKREGFVLIMTLIIVIVGLGVIAVMFNSVTQFTGIFSQYRQVYVDTITARNYIEIMKGGIVATNNARDTVLHGPDNQSPSFESDIRNLDGLLITGDNNEFILDRDVNIIGPQRIEVRVYDANYTVHRIVPDFPINELYELPPSFFAGGSVRPDWYNEGQDGSDYNRFEELPIGGGAYEKYGAYLVRVKVFNKAYANKPEKLVRTTEEVFLQVIP